MQTCPQVGTDRLATCRYVGLSLRKPQARGLAGGPADSAAADGPDVLLLPRRHGRPGLPLRVELHGRRGPRAPALVLAAEGYARVAEHRGARRREAQGVHQRDDQAAVAVGTYRWPNRSAIGCGWPSISSSRCRGLVHFSAGRRNLSTSVGRKHGPVLPRRFPSSRPTAWSISRASWPSKAARNSTCGSTRPPGRSTWANWPTPSISPAGGCWGPTASSAIRPAVKLDVLRHPGYAICPAIVQRCELDTNLSPDGQSQTQARFKLRTKAVYLQVKLPEGAELWSAELNGSPLKPQREGRSVLIDVPAEHGRRHPGLADRLCGAGGRGGAARHGGRARPAPAACGPSKERRRSKCRWPISSGGCTCPAATKWSARAARSPATS